MDSTYKRNSRSANGAKCNSQGASAERSEARRPWDSRNKSQKALKVRNRFLRLGRYAALSELGRYLRHLPGATRFAALSACPWLLHSRAFGAQESDNSTSSTRCTSNLNPRLRNDKWKILLFLQQWSQSHRDRQECLSYLSFSIILPATAKASW